MKKVNWTIVILSVFMLIIMGLIISVITAFYGNPITKLIATSQIRSYVEKNYPDMNLEVAKAGYNFKFEDYVSRVQSTTSADTGFSVNWHKGKINDSYEIDVLKRYKTYQRLQRELSDVVEETISREFPYQTSILFADSDKSTDDFTVLSLDMPLDTMTIPLPTTLTIYFYHDKINYEVFCEQLKELYDIMNKNNIRIDFYSVVMEEPSVDGEKPKSSGEAIYLYDYPADKLISQTLAEDIKKYMADWEREHEK
jgi:hypothetical protein